MESGPPNIIEAVAAVLLPAACREEILGDLRERRRSSAAYLLEAAHVIPCVIYSRIRRTTDGVIALTEALAMYTAFVTTAWWLNRLLLGDERGFLRLAIPPGIFLATIVLADVYSNPKRRWPLKPLCGPLLGLALVYAVQFVLGQWALPPEVLAWGSVTSTVAVSMLRLVFPPITDRPQAANGPAYWQKLALSPLSLGGKDVLLTCVILVAVIVYLMER
jgi:hypothetical protein